MSADNNPITPNLGKEEKMTLDEFCPEGTSDVSFFESHRQGRNRSVLTLFRGYALNDDGKMPGFEEQVKTLGFTEQEIKTLVRRVLAAMLERQEEKRLHWDAALLVAREYLPEDKQLFKELLLCAVVHAPLGAFVREGFTRTILPKSTEESTVQDVVDYLREMGCTEYQIRTAWKKLLKRAAELKMSCFAQYFMCAKTGLIKIGGRDLLEEAEPLAREVLMRDLQHYGVAAAIVQWMGEPNTADRSLPLTFKPNKGVYLL